MTFGDLIKHHVYNCIYLLPHNNKENYRPHGAHNVNFLTSQCCANTNPFSRTQTQNRRARDNLRVLFALFALVIAALLIPLQFNSRHERAADFSNAPNTKERICKHC